MFSICLNGLPRAQDGACVWTQIIELQLMKYALDFDWIFLISMRCLGQIFSLSSMGTQEFSIFINLSTPACNNNCAKGTNTQLTGENHE